MAAREGFTLVSGGASGADTAAQEACLAAGGTVICFVPDELSRYAPRKNLLYCSADGYDLSFSASRALRRNHFIHALGEKVFVAQCPGTSGGTAGQRFTSLATAATARKRSWLWVPSAWTRICLRWQICCPISCPFSTDFY